MTYGSGSTLSHFRYWVSNDPFNPDSTLRNWYWNTKQKIGQPDSVDAESLEVAKFKDGRYWVKVVATDIRNNADTESLFVHIDNFNPRMKKTDPTPWFAFVPTRKHKIWCIFSEAMDRTEDISISGNQEEGYQVIGLSEVEIYLTFYIINQEEV